MSARYLVSLNRRRRGVCVETSVRLVGGSVASKWLCHSRSGWRLAQTLRLPHVFAQPSPRGSNQAVPKSLPDALYLQLSALQSP